MKVYPNNASHNRPDTIEKLVSNQTIFSGFTTTFILLHKSALVNKAKKMARYQTNQIAHNLVKNITQIIAEISKRDVNLIENANQANNQMIKIIIKKPLS